jgi:hypothetical protein
MTLVLSSIGLAFHPVVGASIRDGKLIMAPVWPIDSARSINQGRRNRTTEWEIAQLPGIQIEPAFFLPYTHTSPKILYITPL